MALKIVWTKRAINGYENIISYLEENWTKREVSNFVRDSERFFKLLSQYPEMLQKSRSHKNVFRGPLDKHNIITYRLNIKRRQIELLNIRSARKRPLKG